MSRRNVFVIVGFSLLCWVVILGGASLALAQEATEAAPVVEPTPEPPPVVVVETPSLGERFALFFGGIVAGAVAAGGAILAIVRSVKANPAWELAIERLWESQPVETRQRVRRIVEGGHEIFDELDRVTDGQPNSAAPPATLNFKGLNSIPSEPTKPLTPQPPQIATWSATDVVGASTASPFQSKPPQG